MADITQEEANAIDKLRCKVGEILDTDYFKSDEFLIRWLRTRDLQLEEAESMLRNHFDWRKDNRIDFLLDESPDQYFSKNFPYWLNGIDVKGRPVLCVSMGDWDVRKVVEDGRIPGFQVYINRMYERIVESIVKYNARRKPDQEPITEYLLLVNWDKFSVQQTGNIKAVQTLLGAAIVYEAHYPEILGEALFLNTNPVFQILFALMKPLLAPRTLSKIVCYGTGRADWEPVVRSVVEEHQIPRQFGG